MAGPRILIVDDEEGMREVCSDTLEAIPDATLITCADPQRAVRLLAEGEFDLLLTDIQMPGMSGVELLTLARKHDPELPVVMITGFPSVETAVSSLKLGAVDYLTKPFLPEELLANVTRFLEERRLRSENRLLRQRLEGTRRFGSLIGESDAMRVVFDLIDRVASTDVDVLIQGETGTGKELVAGALHERSRRSKERFVPVDCGAIPETLLESEFFGYEKGAFTGAQARTTGLLEYANRGTFFLDELGELPIQLQAKLLRALQERQIRRVGGKTEISVDIRIVSATARDLLAEVAAGRFREDLFYRINVVQIAIPPLRERGDDVLLLAEHFRVRCGRELGREVSGFADEVLEILLAYRWPGNVRELMNVVRRGIAMARGDKIQVDDLPDHLVLAAGHEKPIPDAPEPGFFDLRAKRLASFERDYLIQKLREHGGEVSAAAVAAQIPRGTFYRLLKNYEIKPAEFRG
ncbi:MAG: sigma-54-dependent Fis family transcriptional regulator [Planctomycetes bacterium]|nr:sigma-54-dependent Fis family transcriptional regulator [Planctomycetota bacterium]